MGEEKDKRLIAHDKPKEKPDRENQNLPLSGWEVDCFKSPENVRVLSARIENSRDKIRLQSYRRDDKSTW